MENWKLMFVYFFKNCFLKKNFFKVQNDDAGSSTALSHTNGRTSQPLKHGKDTERDTASASSRDSATPRSGKIQVFFI
jgi:hypothetical protein